MTKPTPPTAFTYGDETVFLKQTEVEYLRLCCRDISNREIAKRMGKSIRTVENYRDDVLLKLQVRSRVGLVLWCIKVKLVKIAEIDLTVKKRKRKKK